MEFLWSRLEVNLASLRTAGIQAVGEELPRPACGGGPREQQIQEYVRGEQRRRLARAWKWKK